MSLFGLYKVRRKEGRSLLREGAEAHWDNGGFQVPLQFMIVTQNHYTHSPSSKERSKKTRKVKYEGHEERSIELVMRKWT